MPDVVNLDALIPREDFLALDGVEAGASGKAEISRTDLLEGESFYLTLRKPDFQRETAAWSPQAVCDFIQAFIEGDLIPSVICWQSPSRLSFIIDGAHRLSAIIAWLNDDYGDGDKSAKFYSNNIPDEQRRIAAKTKALVDSTIGAYRDYRAEMQNPGSNPHLTDRTRALAHSKIPLLWIKAGDSRKAEHAFLTINQAAVEIDPTELRILQSRFTPNAVAARAIVRNGTGYKYWNSFSEAGQSTVVALGKAINKMLYSPPLQQPIRSTDLPLAGHGYGSQTLPLIFDFVNIANGLPVVDASKQSKKKAQRVKQMPVEPERPDEGETIVVLQNAEKLARLLTGTHPSSLGLHPAIYFYSASGRHQPTAVLAVADLIRHLAEADKLLAFTSVRAVYEDFLRDHKMFVNQLTTQHGSMAKGYKQLRDYFAFVLDQFIAGMTPGEVSALLKDHDKYQRLVKERPVQSKQPKEFSQSLKQWAFLKEAIERSIPCRWCNARIDYKAMQLDHVRDKKEGGYASGDNAAWSHPFCNSTYKDHVRRKDG